MWKSRVLKLFKVTDIVSAKCFVVVPKREIALTQESEPVKLLLKTVKHEEIDLFCNGHPTEAKVSKIVDDWIYMSPTSRHVVHAYAVYRDPGMRYTDNYMLLTQFYEGYDNIYN
jgi:hypothetical protein